MKFIYLICPVRGVSPEETRALEQYVEKGESTGEVKFHFPPRDVNQSGTEVEINEAHRDAMRKADEVVIFWNGKSIGSHFDLGMAWALGKKVAFVMNPVARTEGKSYTNFLCDIAENRVY